MLSLFLSCNYYKEPLPTFAGKSVARGSLSRASIAAPPTETTKPAKPSPPDYSLTNAYVCYVDAKNCARDTIIGLLSRTSGGEDHRRQKVNITDDIQSRKKLSHRKSAEALPLQTILTSSLNNLSNDIHEANGTKSVEDPVRSSKIAHTKTPAPIENHTKRRNHVSSKITKISEEFPIKSTEYSSSRTKSTTQVSATTSSTKSATTTSAHSSASQTILNTAKSQSKGYKSMKESFAVIVAVSSALPEDGEKVSRGRSEETSVTDVGDSTASELRSSRSHYTTLIDETNILQGDRVDPVSGSVEYTEGECGGCLSFYTTNSATIHE